MVKTHRGARRGGAVLFLLVFASATFGQTSRPESRPAAGSGAPASEPAAGLLAGPLVEPAALSERDQQFGRSARRDNRNTVQPRRWLAIARGLELTEEQREAFRVIIAQLERDRRAFQREHGAELRALRRDANRRRGRDAADRSVDQDAPSPRELGRKMQEIQALAPKVPAYQQRMWDVLTPAQQDEFRTRLRKLRAEMKERRNSDGATRDKNRKSKRDDAPPRGDSPTP